jgi:hypothetical protein
MEPIKCTYCKKNKDETEFGFYKNKRRKYCITCVDKRNKNKCPHNKRKDSCKECGGTSFCEHQRLKIQCKECGGSQICEHNKRRTQCKKCGGGGICEHQRVRGHCKECGGVGICEHNKRKTICVECGGGGICEHQRVRGKCKECEGGQICEHKREKYKCKDCGGSQICEHQRLKNQCKQCSPLHALIGLQRRSLQRVLKRSDLSKTKTTIEYLGCSAEHFMEYLKLKMTPDMTIYNIHIDHIKPVSRFNLDDHDEFLDCCHYTNFQPLLAKDNLEKKNKWTKKDEIYWKENIRGLETTEIYLT